MASIQQIVQSYKKIMMSVVNNDMAVLTRSELNLNVNEFNFVTNFIKEKFNDKVNISSSDEFVHITPKNITYAQINKMVSDKLYIDHICQNSYIRFPGFYKNDGYIFN